MGRRGGEVGEEGRVERRGEEVGEEERVERRGGEVGCMICS